MSLAILFPINTLYAKDCNWFQRVQNMDIATLLLSSYQIGIDSVLVALLGFVSINGRYWLSSFLLGELFLQSTAQNKM